MTKKMGRPPKYPFADRIPQGLPFHWLVTGKDQSGKVAGAARQWGRIHGYKMRCRTDMTPQGWVVTVTGTPIEEGPPF